MNAPRAAYAAAGRCALQGMGGDCCGNPGWLISACFLLCDISYNKKQERRTQAPLCMNYRTNRAGL